MTDGLIPVHGLAPLRNRYLGGNYWDSEPQLIALVRTPSGTDRALPVTSFSAPDTVEEIFPRKDVEEFINDFRPILAATITVKVAGGEYQSLKLIARENGIYAVYKRRRGETGFDELLDLADSTHNLSQGLPTHPETEFGRVYETHEKGEEHVETEEVEVERYGQTETVEQVSEVSYDRETTYFAAEVRLFSVDGADQTRGDESNEGLADEMQTRVVEAFDCAGAVPEMESLEYTIDDEKCECREFYKNKPAYGNIIEYEDKQCICRCPDCGGIYRRRNPRELADGMY